MDHLSSCYFCGAALDEPLGVYTVESADGEPSVTLCASCRHKLDRLLDENGIGQTVPAHLESERSAPEEDHQTVADSTVEEGEDNTENATVEETDEDEPDSAVETTAEQDHSEQQPNETDGPAVGETDPTELLSESEHSGLEDESKQAGAESDETESKTADEWTPDPEEFGESGERSDTLDDRPTGEQHPEPVTTDPEELPDDEEIREIPGLTASDDESASGGWATDIQDEMQPDVPEEFGESASQDDAATTTTEDDAARSETAEGNEPTGIAKTAEGDESTIEEHEPTDHDDIEGTVEADDDDESVPFESDDPLASDPESDPLTEETGDEPAGEEGIDPSILQADEIASGNADIEEVLDDEIEIPDELATELDETDEGESPTDSPSTPEPETNGQTAVDSEDSFDLDIEPETESVESEDTSEDTTDDGGFDFDNEPGTTTDDDEDLQSEMEPDVPEQFRNDSGEQSDGKDTDTLDEATDSGILTEDDETEPSQEEIAFTDESGDEPATTEPAELDEQPGIEEGDEPTVSAEPDRDEPNRADTEESDGERRQSISALEYNKVMRLLQNREFPVDRMELMAVAANTYDLSESDCAEVLEMAIDRGLLARDGNKLVKPD
jgi:hypothetical protein